MGQAPQAPGQSVGTGYHQWLGGPFVNARGAPWGKHLSWWIHFFGLPRIPSLLPLFEIPVSLGCLTHEAPQTSVRGHRSSMDGGRGGGGSLRG